MYLPNLVTGIFLSKVFYSGKVLVGGACWENLAMPHEEKSPH